MSGSYDGMDYGQILVHYGVKGMRWGFRRRVGPSGRVAKSEDREVADELRKKNPASMSNAELRKLNERLQLEQTYSQLMSKENAARRQRGANFGKQVLANAKTAQEVYSLYNSPFGKATRALIEAQFKK